MLTTKSLYRGVLVVAITIAFGSVNNPQAARADYYYHYDFANSESGGDSNCRNQVDPINTLFEGNFATAYKLQPLINKHVGWGHNTTRESDGMLKHSGSCLVQDEYNKLGNIEGHHTRLWTAGTDRFGRYFTAGDAHREHAGDSTQCPGDSVYYRFAGHSGYDEGAYEIYHGTRGHDDKHGLGPDGYYQRTIHRPNKNTYHQCNDNPHQTKVGWNGQEIEYHYTIDDPG